MVVDEVFLETLVPSGDAYDLLATAHDRRGNYATFQICQRVAADTLLARLRDGHLQAWATTCTIDSSHDTTSPLAGEIVSQYDFYSSKRPEKVPNEFWSHYHWAGKNYRTFDPVAGDYIFSYSDGEYSLREGAAYAVHFERQGLPQIATTSTAGVSAITSLSPATSEILPVQADLANHIEQLDLEIVSLKADRERLLAKVDAIAADQTAQRPNSDKFPALSNLALTAWWEWLGDEAQAIDKDTLLDLCKAAFPRNSVSRDRVRVLSGPRKRGPMPIR